MGELDSGSGGVRPDWTPFSAGSHPCCVLSENSTEELRSLSCWSANRFIFQLRSFFGPILLRLGALLFHNSFPAATSTFYALLNGQVYIRWHHDMQNPFVFQRLNKPQDANLGNCDHWAFEGGLLCTWWWLFFSHLWGLKYTFLKYIYADSVDPGLLKWLFFVFFF